MGKLRGARHPTEPRLRGPQFGHLGEKQLLAYIKPDLEGHERPLTERAGPAGHLLNHFARVGLPNTLGLRYGKRRSFPYQMHEKCSHVRPVYLAL